MGILTAQVTGEAYFTKSDFTTNEYSYIPGSDTIFVEAYDPDKNLNSTSIDTLHITLKSSVEIDGEEFILYESSNNSSKFRGEILIDTSGVSLLDGMLNVNKPDSSYFQYFDQQNGFGNPELIQDSLYFWIFMGYSTLNTTIDLVSIYLYKENNPHFVKGSWTEFFVGIIAQPGVIFKFLQMLKLSYVIRIYNVMVQKMSRLYLHQCQKILKLVTGEVSSWVLVVVN